MMANAADESSIEPEILGLFQLWQHHGRKPLTLIIGYATLLLKAESENLTAQQKQFITSIRDSAMRASDSLHSQGDYLQLRFGNMDWKWESVQLAEICEQIVSTSLQYTDKSDVQVNVPDELPPVRADRHWLSIAITNLLGHDVGYRFHPEVKPGIFAQERDDSHVLVRISTGLDLFRGEHEFSAKYRLSIGYDPNDIETFSWPGSNLSVAKTILDRHGSRLEFRKLQKDDPEYGSEGTEFTFILPTW